MKYVYLLKCSDKRTYIGCTGDLKSRLDRHMKGHVPATKPRRPVTLVGYFALVSEVRAFEFGKYLKTGSGRAFLSKRVLG
ncbi:hypothetical protein A2807_00335 [Candidatus Berkelbacteria bacterium RIFCSPHIGHO2_01_FULL_50_36]|nr:MAG: hypothetical protein A2807_00335 [Candidatus Berkelbacteria bacterium RIFCSPHIGHO2_01_FULL_50_36]OGD63859.1 MAG: hypothetical protein A3F39_03410 [Candidatus Berkelbacteria bacterium RIFCSPHIGHO2_12_FULL_50_11]